MSDVTRILNAIEGGDEKATDQLLPLVYEELRILAAQKLSHENPGQTLQATALVHEAYLRLTGDGQEGWNHRGHFFSAAAEAMRRILVEKARQKKSLRRGGEYHRISILETDLPINGDGDDILALDECLAKLAIEHKPIADVVQLYYFAGLTVDQVALAHGISRPTAAKRLAFGRAWLHRELRC
jgi:RNA polymerase sigma factor (TIGR02999 family)